MPLLPGSSIQFPSGARFRGRRLDLKRLVGPESVTVVDQWWLVRDVDGVHRRDDHDMIAAIGERIDRAAHECAARQTRYSVSDGPLGTVEISSPADGKLLCQTFGTDCQEIYTELTRSVQRSQQAGFLVQCHCHHWWR